MFDSILDELINILNILGFILIMLKVWLESIRREEPQCLQGQFVFDGRMSII